MSSILRDLASKFVLPLWNQKNLKVIDTYVAPGADIQTTFLKGQGPRALKQNVKQFFNAFSTLEYTIQESTLSNQQILLQWRGEAIHTGTAFNVEPTGKRVYFSGITSISIQQEAVTRYHCFSDLPRTLMAKTSFQKANLFNLFSSDIEKIASMLQDVTGKRLTKREVETLSLWLKGYSIKDTAKLLGGLSNRTVQTFRENTKRKLSVETYQQLFSLLQDTGVVPILLMST